MSPVLTTALRSAREARRWSQEELARRAGISRAEVSAIETGRTVPSTAVALGLAHALGRSVESIFSLSGGEGATPDWAWAPSGRGDRFWIADVGGKTLRYPVDASARATLPHDGIGASGARGATPGSEGAERTLVVAGCDPAVGILGEELRRSGIRVLPFVKSSRRALELLAERHVHVAGVHLAESTSGNLRAGRAALGGELRIVHVTRWSEGVALAPGLGVGSARAAVTARLRWVGRDEGSGARACMDSLLDGRTPPRGYDRTASDHHGVVETIRTGWAQAGICVQIAAEEGGLDFLPVRSATYDLCFLPEMTDDPRIDALLDAVRGSAFRRTLAELPGYDPRDAGALA